MRDESISAALIREHHEIDAGVEQFVARIEELGQTPSDDQIREAAALLADALSALRRHIYLEEEFVFPSLSDPSLQMAMLVMYREHGQIWRLMDQAQNQIAGHGAAVDVMATCKTMLAELERHNAKEEPIIYPHTDADLSREKQEQLARFLESGEMPAGWTCREASEPKGGRKLPF